MAKKHDWHKETAMIHEGYNSQEHQGSLAVPLYQTATYVFDSAEQGERRFAGEEAGPIYSRLGNPTVDVLEERIARMEEGAMGLAFASGMAAVSAVLVHVTKANDHVICSRGIYGCTFGLLKVMEEKYGVTHDLIAMRTEEEIERAVKPETTCIYVETPINPTMELVDLQAVVTVARRHNLRVIVDNTFCSPYIQTPLMFGVDYVLHSATKYLNGHGDVIAGLLVGKDADEMKKLKSSVLTNYGGIISPFDAWLLLRGMKTLPIRMDRHAANAKVLFDYLKKQEMVDEVFYPFDEAHPQYEIAKKQMKSGGGLISFTIKGGKQEAQCFMNHLSLIPLAVSLGDAETLLQHPASMTHAGVPKESREKMGITDALLRISVGLEHVDDLIADLDQAFKSIK